MINISEIVSTWAVVGGWSISPGVPWCKKGYRIKVSANCKLGDDCTLGDSCTLGYSCTLGDGCKLGYCCTLGPNATDPIDLGITDGYRKCLCNVNDVAYIGAGCRWFSLSDAIEHWGSHRSDRRISVAQMAYAKTLATSRGWVLNEG